MNSNGLQAERTALAWTRTSLAALVNAALMSTHHLTGRGNSLPTDLAVTYAIILTCVFAGFAHLRRRALLSNHEDRVTLTKAPWWAAAASIVLAILVITALCLSPAP